ncbi:enoyl-CoA hydratase/isomerase family protein [Mycobacterium sp. SMC-4]|uniref:enoyl-CoA hydratase/isomerase family protein n=1 Tax=Mycobacterium sp. SMC-4 TaxID=2857059 RepID=UPI003CFFCA80
MNEVMIEHPAPGVAVVRMCAPERKNALTGDSARQLLAALRAVDADEEVGALILTGTPEAFCAGAHRDLLDAVSCGEPQATADISDVYELFEVMRTSRVPIIAAVRGAAVGAGLNLALAADVRVVADNAYLRSMFVANSIHPGGAHLQMLERLGGREATTLMAILDEPLSGAAFAERGWAAEALPDHEVENRALALARRAGRAAGLARLIKASAAVTAEMSSAAAAAYEGARQRKTLTDRRLAAMNSPKSVTSTT